jgi:hypothetical protein
MFDVTLSSNYKNATTYAFYLFKLKTRPEGEGPLGIFYRRSRKLGCNIRSRGGSNPAGLER